MKAWWVALLALFVVVADRLTKIMVIDVLAEGQSIALVPGFFSLVHVRNPGAAFGLLAEGNAPWRQVFLIGVAIAAVAGLAWLVTHTPVSKLWERGAAAAVIGGALGNLYDRFVYGEVIDFLDVYVGQWHWPAFNVADSAITVGACVLVVVSLLGERVRESSQ